MGYTVSVKCRNPKLKSQMYDFLMANLKSWEEIVGRKDEYAGYYLAKKGVYSPRYNLAIDYNCSDPQHTLVWSLAAFMAIKVGKDPYFYYDEEKIQFKVIEDRKEMVEGRFFHCNKDGYHIERKPRLIYDLVFIGGDKKKIKKELNRLSELWDKLREK